MSNNWSEKNSKKLTIPFESLIKYPEYMRYFLPTNEYDKSVKKAVQYLNSKIIAPFETDLVIIYSESMNALYMLYGEAIAKKLLAYPEKQRYDKLLEIYKLGPSWAYDSLQYISAETRKILSAHNMIDKYYLNESLYGSQVYTAMDMLNRGTLQPRKPHMAIVKDNYLNKDFMIYDSYVDKILMTIDQDSRYDALIKMFEIGFSWLWSVGYTTSISPAIIQLLGARFNRYYIGSNQYNSSISEAIRKLNSGKLKPRVPGMAIFYSEKCDKYFFAYIRAVNDIVSKEQNKIDTLIALYMTSV